MENYDFTLEEVETVLRKGLLGRVVTFTRIDNTEATGVLTGLTARLYERTQEVMIRFRIGNEWLLCDIFYFSDYLSIYYVGTYTGEKTDVRGILEGYRRRRQRTHI